MKSEEAGAPWMTCLLNNSYHELATARDIPKTCRDYFIQILLLYILKA